MPFPTRTMLKGFFAVSLLAMCRVAVLFPKLVGANRTVKVVDPLRLTTGGVGSVVR